MEPPNYDSVQLVNITPMSLWFMVPITRVFMGFINHLITGGGPHCTHIYDYIIYNWNCASKHDVLFEKNVALVLW